LLVQMPGLLIATTNKGKLSEYRSLLSEVPFRLVTPADEGITDEVLEGNISMDENARRKAVHYANRSKLITVADDSGLEVDALNGEPGIRSARYAGENASDSDRIIYLLEKLKNVPGDKRTANFRCVVAVATPDGELETFEGECAGVITFQPSGKNGFGYDPIFYIPELGKTMAELPYETKNRISHRARAAREAISYLKRLAEKVKL
jgi:XTP/dITP diphosphohydrolase